jgi:outer membrane murein-binding lipoprotein Lpp
MRARWAVPAVTLPATVLLVALTAGCSHHDGASATTTPTSVPPSGYAEMQKKVDAAESDAAAADRDATTTADR